MYAGNHDKPGQTSRVSSSKLTIHESRERAGNPSQCSGCNRKESRRWATVPGTTGPAWCQACYNWSRRHEWQIPKNRESNFIEYAPGLRQRRGHLSKDSACASKRASRTLQDYGLTGNPEDNTHSAALDSHTSTPSSGRDPDVCFELAPCLNPPTEDNVGSDHEGGDSPKRILSHDFKMLPYHHGSYKHSITCAQIDGGLRNDPFRTFPIDHKLYIARAYDYCEHGIRAMISRYKEVHFS